MERHVKVMEAWNAFIRRFGSARTAWESMRERFVADPVLFDALPVEAQQQIGRTTYCSPFEIVSEDFAMLFWRADRFDEYLIPQEAIDALKEDKPKKTKKEESDAA